jgi:hypothetical protein
MRMIFPRFDKLSEEKKYKWNFFLVGGSVRYELHSSGMFTSLNGHYGLVLGTNQFLLSPQLPEK